MAPDRSVLRGDAKIFPAKILTRARPFALLWPRTYDGHKNRARSRPRRPSQPRIHRVMTRPRQYYPGKGIDPGNTLSRSLGLRPGPDIGGDLLVHVHIWHQWRVRNFPRWGNPAKAVLSGVLKSKFYRENFDFTKTNSTMWNLRPREVPPWQDATLK